MAHLVINDLEHSATLDRNARQAVCGGAFGDLFNLDKLLSRIDNGDVNSNLTLTSRDNFLSPTIVTSLNLYLPVNTVVQLDLDNIIGTQTTAASQFINESPE